MKEHNYFVYILTNKNRGLLYTGVTNNLSQRLTEHYLNSGNSKTFSGRYNCHFLLFFEQYKYVNEAIQREKEIKGWVRIEKEKLINIENAEWKFLNEEIMEWPPKDPSLRSG